MTTKEGDAAAVGGVACVGAVEAAGVKAVGGGAALGAAKVADASKADREAAVARGSSRGSLVTPGRKLFFVCEGDGRAGSNSSVSFSEYKCQNLYFHD
jgi:hypothetical protein